MLLYYSSLLLYALQPLFLLETLAGEFYVGTHDSVDAE